MYLMYYYVFKLAKNNIYNSICKIPKPISQLYIYRTIFFLSISYFKWVNYVSLHIVHLVNYFFIHNAYY